MQRGQVFRRNGSWCLRYYQNEIQDGAPAGRRVCERRSRYSGDYKSEKFMLPLVHERLFPVNGGAAQPKGSLTLAESVENRYLPARKKKLRP
jgi:hypothetical protein